MNLFNTIMKVALVVLLILLSGCQLRNGRERNTRLPTVQPGNQERVLTINGQERSYLLHIPPAYDGQTPFPLVIVLHGGGLNAENAVQMSGMSEKADREGFLVAYPNGSGRLKGVFTWNAGNCCGWAMEQNIDDVAFIKALIDGLKQEFNLDPGRIYVTGASNGAAMAYRLGCELAGDFGAIAIVAGYMAYQPCQPTNPLPVIIFHGTADEFLPYDGGVPTKRADEHKGTVSSVAQAVSFWVTQNQCASVPEKQERGNIIWEAYTKDCTDDSAVILYTIVGGGHAWPGGEKGTLRGDEPTQEISATDLIWEFFKQHPRE